jgi:hypothetical protein
VTRGRYGAPMPRAIACLLAALAVLAGCGGGGDTLSKDEYQQQFKATVARYSERAKQVPQPASDASGAERSKAATQAAGVVHDMAGSLGKLKPPAEVAQAHKDLVVSLRETADISAEAAAKLRAGDTKGAQQAVARLATSGVQRRAAAAQKTFESKGYDLGLGQGVFGG